MTIFHIQMAAAGIVAIIKFRNGELIWCELSFTISTIDKSIWTTGSIESFNVF